MEENQTGKRKGGDEDRDGREGCWGIQCPWSGV
jgi:hypothetical protein